MFPNRIFAVLVVIAIAPGVHAGVISNGDFSDSIALKSFTSTGTAIGEPNGNFAQLETDGSFTRTLEQVFSVPTGASTLAFDFAFSTQAAEGSVPSIPNSFAVSLLTDDSDFLKLLLVDGRKLQPVGVDIATTPLPSGVAYDDSLTIDGFQPFSGGVSYSGRLTIDLPNAVLGDNATIFFDLYDTIDDTHLAIAAIDNLQVTSSGVVPEPTSLAIWAIAIGTLATHRRRRT